MWCERWRPEWKQPLYDYPPKHTTLHPLLPMYRFELLYSVLGLCILHNTCMRTCALQKQNSLYKAWKLARFARKCVNLAKSVKFCSTPPLYNIVAGGMIILGTLCRKMIILASWGIMQPGWEILLSGASSLHEPIYISHRFKPQSFHLDLQSIGITHRFKPRQSEHWRRKKLEALTCNSLQYSEKQYHLHHLIFIWYERHDFNLNLRRVLDRQCHRHFFCLCQDFCLRYGNRI